MNDGAPRVSIAAVNELTDRLGALLPLPLPIPPTPLPRTHDATLPRIPLRLITQGLSNGRHDIGT